jgi:cytochrome c oxidase subunit 1
MGGIYYWFPKMFGKVCNEAAARLSWLFIFLGFNVTFFPQFILGNLGMNRRYHTYIPEFGALNLVSTVGSWMIGLGFLIALGTILQALRRGEKAKDNHWGSSTLEWTTQSPPIHDNFIQTPVITAGPYEYR